MSETTREGVSPMDGRRALAAQMNENRVKQLEDEGFEPAPAEDEKDWEPDPEEAKKAAPEPEPEKPQEEPAPEEVPVVQKVEEPTQQMVRVKVDGEEAEVPLSAVIANYQKTAAADRDLKEAAELKRELRAELEAIRAARKAPEAEKPPAMPEPIAARLRALVEKELEATTVEEAADIRAQQMVVYQEAAEHRVREQRERELRAQQEIALAQAAERARETHERLKAEVSKVHPDWQSLLNNEAFHKGWLEKQPNRVKWMLLESTDPEDPISVFNEYKKGLQSALAETEQRKREAAAEPKAATRKVESKKEETEPDNKDYMRALAKRRGSAAHI